MKKNQGKTFWDFASENMYYFFLIAIFLIMVIALKNK
jgi:hypothetical protein